MDVDLLLQLVAGRFAGQAGAQLRGLEALSTTGRSISGNQHWLELALANLVSNALRYGEGTVRLSATETPACTVLAVSDEGRGFPAEFVDRAFDRFTRADTSRTSRGTGLGLALVHAVAQAHGGTTSIAGARVSLHLPNSAPPT